MDKEKKNGIKEGETMPATLEESKNSFDNFLSDNANKIRLIAHRNAVKNKDGLVVIAKDDSWRKEDWTEHYNKNKKK